MFGHTRHATVTPSSTYGNHKTFSSASSGPPWCWCAEFGTLPWASTSFLVISIRVVILSSVGLNVTSWIQLQSSSSTLGPPPVSPGKRIRPCRAPIPIHPPPPVSPVGLLPSPRSASAKDKGIAFHCVLCHPAYAQASGNVILGCASPAAAAALSSAIGAGKVPATSAAMPASVGTSRPADWRHILRMCRIFGPFKVYQAIFDESFLYEYPIARTRADDGGSPGNCNAAQHCPPSPRCYNI